MDNHPKLDGAFAKSKQIELGILEDIALCLQNMLVANKCPVPREQVAYQPLYPSGFSCVPFMRL